MVGTETTAADLQTAADGSEHAIAMVHDHDVGQVYSLTKNEPVLDIIQPGDAIAFQSGPEQ